MFLKKNKLIINKEIFIYFSLLFCLVLKGFSDEPPKNIKWKQLEKGLFYTEIKAPRITRINDSKISIIKIDPQYFSFEFALASENDSMQRTVKEWCDMKGLIAGINAGMYGGSSHISNVGYMRNYNHINNPCFKQNYKAVAAFNPTRDDLPPFKIIDLEYEKFDDYSDKYSSFSQSMRLIDNKGKPAMWKQKYKMRSSIIALATDSKGNVLFIFSRSPFTPNEFSKILLKSSVNIKNAMYLEGGPESSFYLNNGETVIEKMGSYVSRTFAHDKNNEFRKMPNVIGIKRKIN